MKGAASGVVGDLARARIALDERGQKLGELEDRTAAMMGSAESFSKHAHDVRENVLIQHLHRRVSVFVYSKRHSKGQIILVLTYSTYAQYRLEKE